MFKFSMSEVTWQVVLRISYLKLVSVNSHQLYQKGMSYTSKFVWLT